MDVVSLRLWDYLEQREDHYLMIFDDMDIWTQLERLDLLDHLSDSDDDFAIISDDFWLSLDMLWLLLLFPVPPNIICLFSSVAQFYKLFYYFFLFFFGRA